jgi:hypothetical protein
MLADSTEIINPSVEYLIGLEGNGALFRSRRVSMGPFPWPCVGPALCFSRRPVGGHRQRFACDEVGIQVTVGETDTVQPVVGMGQQQRAVGEQEIELAFGRHQTAGRGQGVEPWGRIGRGLVREDARDLLQEVAEQDLGIGGAVGSAGPGVAEGVGVMHGIDLAVVGEDPVLSTAGVHERMGVFQLERSGWIGLADVRDEDLRAQRAGQIGKPRALRGGLGRLFQAEALTVSMVDPSRRDCPRSPRRAGRTHAGSSLVRPGGHCSGQAAHTSMRPPGLMSTPRRAKPEMMTKTRQG